ncbi:hypothetical protein PAECIP111892_01909 [Paenibacillus auburnensis]|uniref:Uncharacterized protein n=1 Tax=Paenibacillus auburnensis TaxID=2905649 RepID=A0ABM9BUU2_9BACL|nr:hypothetical protein [Paenibacillus auburnensis]CAH1194889.1 hypothetical protein PAECIP111892_01909 [Paenibacillus auburnensis]
MIINNLMIKLKEHSPESIAASLIHPVHVEVSAYIAGVLESAASFCYET